LLFYFNLAKKNVKNMKKVKRGDFEQVLRETPINATLSQPRFPIHFVGRVAIGMMMRFPTP
jgi:hypothetical protein